MSSTATPQPRARFHGFETIVVPVVVRIGKLSLTMGALAELAIGQVLILNTRVGTPFHLLARGSVLAHVEPVASDEGIALKLVEQEEEESDDDASA